MGSRGLPYVLLTRRSSSKRPYPTPPPTSRSSSPPKKRSRHGREESISLAGPAGAGSSSGPGDVEYREGELDLGEGISSKENGIPIRHLSHFCIYDHGQLVQTTELLGLIPPKRFTASGFVKVHHLDPDDDDEEDEDRPFVKDLHIIEFNVHAIDRGKKTIDKYIYIRTPRAWYILDDPAPEYKTLFTPFRLRHQFMHLVVSTVLRNPKATYAEFVGSLPSPLTEGQLRSEEIITHFLVYFPSIAEDLNKSVENVPLLKTLRAPGFYNHKLVVPDDLFEVEHKALVTPIVGAIVTPHLSCKMTVVSSEPEYTFLPESMDLGEHDDRVSLRWGNRLTENGHYDSVQVDGITYRPGDIVSVNGGKDADEERAESDLRADSFCVNTYARRVWFIQIAYLFEDNKNLDKRGKPLKKLHGSWLVHGSRTLVQEAAHSQELFLLEECHDIHVSSIFRKCSVRELEVDKLGPLDAADEKSTTYFTRFVWDEDGLYYKDPPTPEDQMRLKRIVPDAPCVNCGRKDEEELRPQLVPIGDDLSDGFSQFGKTYHVNDFAFVKPLKSDLTAPTLLRIGRILEIRLLGVNSQGDLITDLVKSKLAKNQVVACRVRYFERYTSEALERYTSEKISIYDHLRLFQSLEIGWVKAENLMGVPFVKLLRGNDAAIDHWLQDKSILNRFYTNTRLSVAKLLVPLAKDQFEVCEICTGKHEQESVQRKGPIKCFDIFSGAGGLARGLEDSGFIRTNWSVEINANACGTFEANHPGAHVICENVNDVLKYIADRNEGKVSAPLRRADGSTIPDDHIPRRGEVDMLAGGPPCQPFSGANLHRREDDVQSTLPYTMLGLVEVLQPTYVLLENVTGLAYYDLTGSGKRVKMAVIKLVEASLLALGYQVRVQIPQVGEYGAPQDRERVIFLAAKRGHKLPELPTPTHAFFKAGRDWKFPLRKSDRIRRSIQSKTDEQHIYAAHPPVTVDDAIDDLPKFDWVNPHTVIRQVPGDVEEQSRRDSEGIVQCTVKKGVPAGFAQPVALTTKARTRYQRTMRREDGLVSEHLTQSFPESVVEPTTLVPLRPWSNYRHLPKEFPPKDRSTPHYGRLDGNNCFKTAMTRPRPNKPRSWFLHPHQKRSLTLREVARSQGFPDSYVLCSTNNTASGRLRDYFQQVGNAVPVPLAAALGRSIRAAWMHDCNERDRREESVEL
ncbi:S-adenosyl-L-methionine-dependent methyltransferase [Mycena alexandri]|uniref:Cytosine-specific methyltransferase n=1 Tax=Mycena alexandri TaxID=1745969 RepID=A0AAD6SH50_9AGAR|nr:S-adenosyl-L-methionine-dependent methyltransferase [Mycena alexandri]